MPRRDPTTQQSRSIAARVAIAFLAAGALWILTTDTLLYRLVSDPVVIGRMETAKGWTMVALSAAFLYWIVDRSVRHLARSEATLKAVVDSIADGVLLLRKDRMIGSANAAAARMLGVASPGELVGMGAEEFTRRYNISRTDGSLVKPDELISQRALSGDQQPSYKAILRIPNHGELVAICTSAPVRPFPGGSVELAVSVLHDVTELEHLDHMREQFVSAAAHELRTPVTIIKACVHLLTMSAGSSADVARMIDRQCGKIVRLTDNLIVLARIRSDSLRLHLEPVHCASLVEQVTEEMSYASADHAVIGRIEANPIVFGDRDRLALVIRNLIDLAYYRSRPRTEITIGVSEHDHRARIGVTYEALGVEAMLEHGDLGIEHHVIDSLAGEMRGVLGSEQDEQFVRTEWIELPTMIEEP
jgi:two-component system, OmpR family, phosphate regulon sensor histidine kinase PhoR